MIESIRICPICKKGRIITKNNSVFTIECNPKVTTEGSFDECDACGEKFFDEEQSLDIAKKIDKKMRNWND